MQQRNLREHRRQLQLFLPTGFLGRSLRHQYRRVSLRTVQEQRHLHRRDQHVRVSMPARLFRQNLRRGRERMREHSVLQRGLLRGQDRQLHMRLFAWFWWPELRNKHRRLRATTVLEPRPVHRRYTQLHVRLQRHRLRRSTLREKHRRLPLGTLRERCPLYRRYKELQVQVLRRLHGKELRDGRERMRELAVPVQWHLPGEIEQGIVQERRVNVTFDIQSGVQLRERQRVSKQFVYNLFASRRGISLPTRIISPNAG